MNRPLLRIGTREVVQHPRRSLRVSASALKHWRAILAAANAAKQASRYGATVKQSATNPRVQAEARLAVMSLVLATKRARKVGVAGTPHDKRVMAQLLQARHHAAKAARIARHPRRRERVIRTTMVLAGAGAVGGAAYAGSKLRAQPPQPLESAPANTTAPGSTPTDGKANRLKSRSSPVSETPS
jgi:hypothetical protein